jgi:hypothetical protein
MPVLDAKALKTDRKGLAFLRAVLSKGQDDETAARKPKQLPSKRPFLRSFLNVNR